MGMILIRIIFMLLMLLGSYIVGLTLYEDIRMGYIFAYGGFSIALIAIALEFFLRRLTLQVLFVGFVGLFFGIILANLLSYSIFNIPVDETTQLIGKGIMNAVFGYLGVVLALRRREELNSITSRIFSQKTPINESYKILDTSVIIDGRIADICESGFIEGILQIPQFILKELQQIADSSDSLKRNRGRRGLDVLQKIQKMKNIKVEIHDLDFPHIKEVDRKLIEFAKSLGGKVLTNDYNLNKIAELQGVVVLNINELANALKPVVLPGEIMHVYILKEGKEAGQGVAYLDDGTMVVVDHGKKYMGQSMDVVVTSVLQTTAGRMIFTRLKEEEDRGLDQ